MTATKLSAYQELARQHGQEHLFDDWGSLTPAQRESLLTEISKLDFDLVAKQAALLKQSAPVAGDTAIEPAELFPLDRSAEQQAQAKAAQAKGEELLTAGAVGFLLVAGGQASRLGYDGPKGTFPVGPVSGRSLFDYHARRLLALQKRFGVAMPWYVMTSEANDASTRAYFSEHGHFGLKPEDVFFFPQAMNPALDTNGKVVVQSPGKLFWAPNGHGGVLLALRESGALEDAKRRGVEHFSFFQVDNPLVQPGDTLFLGLHAEANADMSSKVVSKRDAGEKVGVIGRVNGRMGCIEYSDLPAELLEAKDESGQLQFRAGNIAMHVIRRGFVEELTEGGLQLPWHIAKKDLKVERDGAATTLPGHKFETFVFDALGRSRASVTLEVDRAVEFSPVKNAEGSDSPATARRDLCALHGSWVAAAGLPTPDAGSDGVVVVEVDPLLAEDSSSFASLEQPAARKTDRGWIYE